MTGAYLSYLPRAFIRSIAGFPQEGKGYFLPRARETPPTALCLKIWPEVDVWLERMEAYRPKSRQRGRPTRSRRLGIPASPLRPPGGFATGLGGVAEGIPTPSAVEGPPL
jgi:hypothetical protein